MSSKALIVGIIIFGAVVVGQITELPTSKVTVKVLDEGGNPIVNASVIFGFLEAHPKWGAAIGVPVNTTTDAAGMASGSGHSDTTIGCEVKKMGYYDGWPSSIEFNNLVLEKWQPWNKVYLVVLKKIVDPIPMYAKKIETKIPAMDRPIGYDLAAGDWVQPFGKGTSSDFIFSMSQTLNGQRDYNANLTVVFANKGDGLQVAPQYSGPDQGGSRLKFPRNAPQDGYLDKWTTTISQDASSFKEEHSNGIGYFFRVRTIKTSKGDIQSADYGKIDGDISIIGAATAHPGITFTYYFNPTGTTNLEFDPAKNLLKNLEFLEQVQTP